METKKYGKEELQKLRGYLGYGKLEDTFTHTPKIFKEVFQDPKDHPVFVLKNFKAKDMLFLAGLIQAVGADILKNDLYALKVIQRGLVSFSNYFDLDGNEVPFEKDRSGEISEICFNKLGLFIINDLVEALMNNPNLTGEEESFSESLPSA
jgi:hypothetical protein